MDAFSEITSLVLGDGAYELSKFHAPSQDKPPSETTHRLAMAGNTLALAGAGHALYATAKEYKASRGGAPGKHAKIPEGVKMPKVINDVKPAAKVVGAAGRLGSTMLRHPKLAALPAAAWGGLHGIELLSDVQGRAAMKREHAKRKVGHIQKMSPVAADVHMPSVPKNIPTPGKVKRKLILQPVDSLSRQVNANMGKSFTWEGEISKVDSDKRQVFGWASIVEMNGQPVVDLQGDYIDIDEIEKSAYEYVIKSRKGGEMHRRDGDAPVHVSDMIESFLVTPEKKEKLGLPDSMPTGWWVGYQINDDEAWNLVKSGKRTGFSIHGRGRREDDML